MTENSKRVFTMLKDNHGMDITAQEIAKELNVPLSAVTGSVNGLTRKGLAVRTEVQKGEDEKGKPIIVKYVSLTEAGMAYDPEAEEAAKKAAKSAE